MIALFSLLLLAAAPADSTDSAALLVRQTVTEYIAPHDPTPEAELWSIAWADANGDGLQDAFVLSGDPDWCGPKGCTLLVIEAVPEFDHAELGAYLVAAEIKGVSPPVRISTTANAGWCDLLVQNNTAGSVRLLFDGETYPFNVAEGTPEASGVDTGPVLFATAD